MRVDLAQYGRSDLIIRSVTAMLVAILAAATVWACSGLVPISNGLSDLRFAIKPRPTTGGIAMVEIDGDSIRRMGAWPWSRSVYATAIDRLIEAGATDIAIDVDLSSP